MDSHLFFVNQETNKFKIYCSRLNPKNIEDNFAYRICNMDIMYVHCTRHSVHLNTKRIMDLTRPCRDQTERTIDAVNLLVFVRTQLK